MTSDPDQVTAPVTPDAMPLIEACRNYAGRAVLVLPYYGFGWNRQDGTESPATLQDTLGPEPFHLQIGKVVSVDGELMAVTGTICEANHKFNGYWCACLLRSTTQSDFTENPGDYMVWIAPNELPMTPAPYPEKALYEWVQFSKNTFCLCGSGTVAENVEWIRDIFSRTMASRRSAGVADL